MVIYIGNPCPLQQKSPTISSLHFIIIPPYFHKTLCRINRIRAYTLVCLLLVFRNLCCGTHNNSIWRAILLTYGLPLVYLSQAKSIQLRAYILLLSLAYLFLLIFLFIHSKARCFSVLLRFYTDITNNYPFHNYSFNIFFSHHL